MLGLAFALALAAGAALGLLAAPRPEASAGAQSDRSWLADQLHLTPDQRDKMRSIWENAHEQIRAAGEERTNVQREWDQAVYDLLSPEEKARYQELRQKFLHRTDEIDRRVQQTFDDANSQTRQILTPSQQKEFEAIIAGHRPEVSGAARNQSPGLPAESGAGGRVNPEPPGLLLNPSGPASRPVQ